MILPSILVVFAAALAGLYWHLGKQPDRRSLWRRTLQIGLGVGLARAGLASWGWYTIEHTGGPLQIPAFALAMLALPEAAIFFAERRTSPVPPEFTYSCRCCWSRAHSSWSARSHSPRDGPARRSGHRPHR